MQKQFLKINLTEGTKDISEAFVESVKNKKPYELQTFLKDGIADFSIEKRATKKKKILDRINVVVDRICKNLEISDIQGFETHPTILSVVGMLNKANLAFEVLDENRTVVECSLVTAEAVA